MKEALGSLAAILLFSTAAYGYYANLGNWGWFLVGGMAVLGMTFGKITDDEDD